MAAETKHANGEITAIRRADGESRTLAASLPRLVLEARRIAANVIHGLHGRRRAGSGESFWQYRRFVSGEPSQNVDWRRSARDDHLYVREQEWEAAHTVWLWPDRSASMAFASKQARDSKLERGLIVTFALAELLVAGGERVGIPGLMRPTSSRNIVEKMAETFLHDPTERAGLPPTFAPSPQSEIVVLSDLWSPIDDVHSKIAQLSVPHCRLQASFSSMQMAASQPRPCASVGVGQYEVGPGLTGSGHSSPVPLGPCPVHRHTVDILLR